MVLRRGWVFPKKPGGATINAASVLLWLTSLRKSVTSLLMFERWCYIRLNVGAIFIAHCLFHDSGNSFFDWVLFGRIGVDMIFVQKNHHHNFAKLLYTQKTRKLRHCWIRVNVFWGHFYCKTIAKTENWHNVQEVFCLKRLVNVMKECHFLSQMELAIMYLTVLVERIRIRSKFR